MRSLRRSLCILCLLVLATMLSGCFGSNNTVRLTYDRSSSGNIVPSSTAPRIVVVMFEDKRGRIDIGVHKDGSPFNPASSVAEWASRGLADELAKLGAQVSMAASLTQARSSNPDYIVGGTVEHVWLTENNISSCTCVVRLQTHLHRADSPVQTRKYSAQEDKAGIPGPRLHEATLSAAMFGALSNAASTIMSGI
ncbi:MAG: hypothetical protein II737_04335 [Mailhella sp.]|nr:hypothetical protein [Mailhella sp.]